MVTIAAIVPTTGRSMLEDALASVRRQSRPVDEIVVVHDTTSEPEVLRPEVSTVWTRGARNPCVARNLGAATAQSDYLAFLDDDDYWLDEHIEVVAAELEKTRADVVCTSFWEQFEGQLRPELTAPERLEFEAFLCRNPGFRGSNLVISGAVYRGAGGFDPNFPALNDLDLGVRLADRGVSFRGIAERTVVFRQHSGARLSTHGSKANRGGILAFWNRYNDRMSPTQKEKYADWATAYWHFEDFRRFVESM